MSRRMIVRLKKYLAVVFKDLLLAQKSPDSLTEK
jgi:hypothetical protein